MSTKDKIITLDAFLKVRDSSFKNDKIVFTNGCFDILHLGHIDYLEKAKEKGDILVIGLNTDKSIQRLKGPERPIVDETARARLIAALAFVDYVILFDEETPLQLIEAMIPNVLVKGNDYSVSNIVGAGIVLSNGGKVETIQVVPGYSTSKLIELIKQQ